MLPTDNNPDFAKLYPLDFKEHQFTRAENDRELSDRLEELGQASDIDSLERFAKAYLGMYLDMNNTIPPEHRIDILANHELAQAVRQGIINILQRPVFPTPAEIADSIESEPFPVGFILLAAMDLYATKQDYDFNSLSDACIIAAVCFHYAYKTESQDPWLVLIYQQRSQQVIQALNAFWSRMISNGTDHLPGMATILDHEEHSTILHDVLLPVLSSWSRAGRKTLRRLLQNAFAYVDHDALLTTIQERIENAPVSEPASYTLWLASGFLLLPEQYSLPLLEYCGRSKEKILPLLDFVSQVLGQQSGQKPALNAENLSVLLRIIAPKIAPQEDRYGALCDNSRKLLFLFYLLAMNQDRDKAEIIERLLQVRVMKLYRPILDFQISSSVNSLEQYIELLLGNNLIRRRIKRYD